MESDAVKPAETETAEKTPEVLPETLSVALSDGSCEALLTKGTALPALAEHVFSAPYKNPHAIVAAFYAGERLMAADNRLLKKVRLVVHKTAGDRIRVTLRIAVKRDGEIEVWLFDHGSHHQKRKVIEKTWLPDAETVSVTDKKDEENKEADAELFEKLNLLHKAKAEVFCAGHLDSSEKKQLEAADKKLLAEQSKKVKGLIKKADPSKMTKEDVRVLKEETNSLKNLLP